MDNDNNKRDLNLLSFAELAADATAEQLIDALAGYLSGCAARPGPHEDSDETQIEDSDKDEGGTKRLRQRFELRRRWECRRCLTRYRESEDGDVRRCELCGSPVDLMITKERGHA